MAQIESNVKIYLNDLNFRYDVFQMVNLFFNFIHIEFVENNGDINIEINDNLILIKGYGKEEKHYMNGEYKLKEEVRKIVFNFLKHHTGKILPWGTLVGIRPSKKALDLLESGATEEEIITNFKDRHETKKEKAQLCIDVAKYEKNIVNKDKNIISVYIGMPFCPTRCVYCSFTSNPISACKSIVKDYLQCLWKEIDEISKYINSKELVIENVYFGGGTPTSVNDEEFHYIMSKIYNSFVVNKGIKEFTVECGRADSITLKKLNTMREYKVDRISINPQSMNDNTLKNIGRNHNSKDVEEKFKMARELGFDNINMDIIVGLPGETLVHIENTCSKIKNLRPDSITVHGMSIKRASKLYENLINNEKFKIPDQEELNEMYEATVNLAKELNMIPYYMYRQKNMVGNMENVGYALNGKECIYNIQMIEEKQTIAALGADAVSKVVFLEEDRIERFGNIKDVREYNKRIDEMIEKKLQLLYTLYGC